MADLNSTPRSMRVHIGFFGKSNAGKSSLINAVTGQDTAIVSEISGTTTDPVYKSMEILPIGPCVLIDTAGLDDRTVLSEKRVSKTFEVLDKTDAAVYVIDASAEIDKGDFENIRIIKSRKIPIIAVFNKADTNDILPKNYEKLDIPYIAVSALSKRGISSLKDSLIKIIPKDEEKFQIVGDLLNEGDFVVLVTPIDSSAPKGRMILPQQQVIRDVLDSKAINIVTLEKDLASLFPKLAVKPKMVITDSQAFASVSKATPRDIPLTSFSILFARAKGDLYELVKGAAQISKLRDGDTILVAEACTHHKKEEDIGSVKIPKWLREKTGKQLNFEYTAGGSYEKDLSKYKLIVHCGACMINRKEMLNRLNTAEKAQVPVVNYGVLIAYINGILDRVLEPFPKEFNLWRQIKD